MLVMPDWRFPSSVKCSPKRAVLSTGAVDKSVEILWAGCANALLRKDVEQIACGMFKLPDA